MNEPKSPTNAELLELKARLVAARTVLETVVTLTAQFYPGPLAHLRAILERGAEQSLKAAEFLPIGGPDPDLSAVQEGAYQDEAHALWQQVLQALSASPTRD